MKKRAHVYYSGYVQGVGFRFTAEDIALRIGLKGWVKNLADGSVEIVCEGEDEDINKFLEKLEGQMKRYIIKKAVEWEDYEGKFKDFVIRFY